MVSEQDGAEAQRVVSRAGCCGAGEGGVGEGGDREAVRQAVHERYAGEARVALTEREAPEGCGDGPPGSEGSGCGGFYDPADLAGLPARAAETALGSGHPVRAAELQPGETVVDLGCGGGVDVLLAARAVGAEGRAIGVDATAEMVELATRHAQEAGAAGATFHHAPMEALPLPDAAADVILSNCVLNLSVDKPAVFAEIARVLRPGGRLVASDLVADDALTPAVRAERGTRAGCVAGALSFAEYRAGLEAAGLVDVDLTVEGGWTDGIHRVLVRTHAGSEAAPGGRF
jgi:SAM-dependent methyltransferase